MKSKIVITIAALIVGFAIGYSFNIFKTEKSTTNTMGMEVGTMMGMNHSMPHPMLEIDTSKPIPSVSAIAIRDAKDGYNIYLETQNFKFVPENVNKNPTQGEGHAHIYVNNIKLARLYGNWFHLGADKLEEGENLIMVTLNANDHSEWAQGGEHISDTIVITK